MNKMILYKEWLKTRWVLLGIALVTAALTAYCFLNLTKVVQITRISWLVRWKNLQNVKWRNLEVISQTYEVQLV